MDFMYALGTTGGVARESLKALFRSAFAYRPV